MSWMHSESEKIENEYKDVSDVISLPKVILQINGKSALPKSTEQVANELENVPNSLKETVISKNKNTQQFSSK